MSLASDENKVMRKDKTGSETDLGYLSAHCNRFYLKSKNNNIETNKTDHF